MSLHYNNTMIHVSLIQNFEGTVLHNVENVHSHHIDSVIQYLVMAYVHMTHIY